METEGRKTISVLMVIVLVLAVAAAAFAIRYKTVPMDDKVLMVERWTGRAIFIYSDGSSNMVESGRSVRGPFLMPKTSSQYAGVQLRAKTRWRSRKAHYLFTAQPFGDKLEEAQKNRKAQFVIEMTDRDGFIIQTLWVPINKMKPVRNDVGEITALEYRMSASLCLQNFKDIKNWKVR
jgi:hypothetical protein